MTVTDADRQRVIGLLHLNGVMLHADVVAQLAAALAAERDRTLASCYGRHEPLSLPVTGPGLVTCDGHTLAFRTERRADPQPVEKSGDKVDGWRTRAVGRRTVRLGETTDIAPHEVIDVVTCDGIPLLTIDGGTGMTGVRFG